MELSKVDDAWKMEEFTFNEERYFGRKKKEIPGANAEPPRHPPPGGKTRMTTVTAIQHWESGPCSLSRH